MTITIDDRKTKRKVDFFSSFKLELKYDSVGSTYSFDFYYNEQNPQHKLFAQVGQYQLVRVEHNNKLILTGFILSQALNAAAVDEIVGFGGYSVPGVLEDSNIPLSVYPLQFDGLTLKQIAEKVLKPFVIKMEIDSSVAALMNQVYAKVTAEPTESVRDFFVKLAKQKNIVVSHTADGKLLFTRAKTDAQPILHFEEGLIGTSFSLVFNGQAMHSPITVIKQAKKDKGNAGQYTIVNPYVPESTTAFRPKTLTQSAGDDNDTKKAAENALAAELKSIVLTITIDRWDVNKMLIEPNNTITVLLPKLYINKKTTFFIESVTYTGDTKNYTAVLTCVLPEVYNGKYPKNIFL